MKTIIAIFALAAQSAWGQTYTTLTISTATQSASVAIPTNCVIKILNFSDVQPSTTEVPMVVLLQFTNGVSLPYGVQNSAIAANGGFQLESVIMPMGSPIAGVARVSLFANQTFTYGTFPGGFATIEIDSASNSVNQSQAVTLSIAANKTVAVNGDANSMTVLQVSPDFSQWQNIVTGSPPFFYTATGTNGQQFFRAVTQ
jgi:hypothetical protein